MFKNQMVQTLVDLQKKGVRIHLTDSGWQEFLKLMSNEEIVELPKLPKGWEFAG